jgi:hypothetical protein
MSMTGVCQVCEAAEATETCEQCGAGVCSAHYDREMGLCSQCAKRGKGGGEL